MRHHRSDSEEISHKSSVIKSKGGAARLFFPILTIVLIAALGLMWRELSQLKEWQVHLQKSLPITFTEDFRVDAAIDHEFPIKIEADIPIQFPVTSVVRIPIKETFLIPLNKTFPVMLDQPLRLKDTVKVRAIIPIDTEFEAKVLGVTMTVPVKGSVPLDIDVPLDQEIRIPNELMVMLQEPLPVSINQTVDAPLDFVINGNLPLDAVINAPVKGVLDCGITVKKPLPVEIDLDISLKDLFNG
ncbi:hypothetical protein [Desulfatibacillum aliphaticivorans]|uniref:hypothetical protein n=1 Tax=Desulfatibacillum aliphaticivorans TaxID=218208 RepID=UPI000427EDA8|nr:hypothetical protein [Desulfatibacillum aliphaticivorans]